MSHIVEIKTEVRDVNAIRAACRRLNLPAPVQGTHRLLGVPNMVDIARPRFSLGRVVATPAALGMLEAAGQSPSDFLDRHSRGDWGDLSAGDRELNDEALSDGSRIFSAYVVGKNQNIWIITEAVGDHGQRASTTILLPCEY